MTQVETPAANTGLAKVAVLCSADTCVVNQTLVLRINICGENRHLRQARERYLPCYPSIRKMERNLEKILTRYFSDVLEEETVETLWAEIIDEKKGLYKIDNIPFYGPKFSCGDIVYAEYDNYEERLTFRKVVEPSGNSTIQIILIDENLDPQDLRDEFKDLGCESEGAGGNYFVMEIPFEKNYNEIFIKLTELENNGTIGFAEPVISDKHYSEKL